MKNIGLWHRIMHRLGLTSGHIEHEKDANGVWWIGMRCAVCGKFMHPIKSKYQDARAALNEGEGA